MNLLSLLFSTFLVLTSCSNQSNTSKEEVQMLSDKEGSPKASIVSVVSSGNSGNYTFAVEISSPDTGCEQYANWWEILTEQGILIYRRILGHSHVNEQPFIRFGRGITISENQVVIIRAHMNSSGYGTSVFKGSVSGGFIRDTLDSSFASQLESQNPLPTTCAF